MRHNEPILSLLGDHAKMRVIKLFLDHIGDKHYFTKNDILVYTGISKTTFLRIWNDLLYFDGVFEVGIKPHGKAKQYRFNPKNPIVRQIQKLNQAINKNSTIP